ncbi:MAG TPA: DEAD/DEAH box helicase, partial [Phycisphaerae bacterium]|nr:DEAD/DEAH box helicase [Phycisphaerae bacterium]
MRRFVASPPSPQRAVSSLDKPVQYVRGVGPARAKFLADLGVHTVGDLVSYFPFRFEEQGVPQPIDSLRLEEPATILCMVERVDFRGGGRFGPPAVHAEVMDSTGRARVTWFNVPYLRERLQRGQMLRLHGKVGVENDIARLTNPSIEWLDPNADPKTWNVQRLIPVYRATEKLTSAQIARIIGQELDLAVRHLPEPLPPAVLASRNLAGRSWAVRAMHRPTDLKELAPARRRLAYEELLLMQLAIALQRRWTGDRGRAPQLPTSEKIDARIRRRFPFALTAAQDRAIARIVADLGRTRPMTRLLQGDVGSGKTVVALYAALVTVANRRQCAILAPTEVLANQHFNSIEKYLAGSRVRRCLLTGKTPAARRRQDLRAIAAGEMDLIIGTQALLEQRVRFKSLGLVIVDEQHKFGVAQRAMLKGASRPGSTQADSRQFLMPHYLVMTATPIPRTLSMTVFGDLDVSTINELPPGRRPITTRLVTPAGERAAWLEVRRRIADGDQVYIVY